MPKSKPLSTKAPSQNHSPASPAPSHGGNGEIHSALTRLNSGLDQQQDALTQASAFVRPGGELIYVTCSVLPQENEEQVRKFTADHPEFAIVSALPAWNGLFGAGAPQPRSSDQATITLTPASTDTDGFFFCRMQRKA